MSIIAVIGMKMYMSSYLILFFFFFFQAEDGIRDVAVTGVQTCALPICVDTFRDEAKLRSSVHLEWRPRMMREHEDGRVVWRLVAPPALPAFVRPRAPDGTEHVAPENPCPDSGEAVLGDPVVDPRLSAVKALHLPPYARGEEPFHQLGAPDAERILETLVRPGPVSVDGDREALDAQFRHCIPRYLVISGERLASVLDDPLGIPSRPRLFMGKGLPMPWARCSTARTKEPARCLGPVTRGLGRSMTSFSPDHDRKTARDHKRDAAQPARNHQSVHGDLPAEYKAKQLHEGNERE